MMLQDESQCWLMQLNLMFIWIEQGDLYCTNIHKDIEDTLILLGYKIREKNIQVNKIFCEDLPEIEVYIGELNQVWTNIIDNAIYAVPPNGEIIIETDM